MTFRESTPQQPDRELDFQGGLIDRRDAKRLFGTIYWLACGAAIIVGGAGLVLGNTRDAVLAAGALAISATCLVMLSRDRVVAAGTLGTVLLVAAGLGMLATGRGIHDVGLAVLAFFIVLSGLLFQRTLALSLGWIVVIGVTALAMSEWLGWSQAELAHLTRLEDVVALGLVLAATLLSVRQLVALMRQGLERAQTASQRYENVFNATSEAIFIHDAETEAILDVNATAARMSGYAREEMIGMTLEESVGDPVRTQEARRWFRAALREGPQILPWEGIARDGRKIQTEITLRATDLGGRPVLLVVMRDVSEQVLLRKSIAQSEKLQAVGQLAGGVAHDFNNQLTGILANASMLEDLENLDPLVRHGIESIISCSRRAADLTNQLLAFARKGKHQEIAVDLDEIVREVASLLARSIDKRIEVETSSASPRTVVLGDPTLLQNAVLNLGLNARDAMPDGGRLEFRTEYLEAFGDKPARVRLTVRDTGYGMDPETQARIFEPFFTTKKSGNGMGLAAVYGVVESHRGTIDVKSQLLEGTVFSLEFPAWEAQGETAESTAGPRLDPELLSGLRVLVAEDEREVAMVTRRALDKAGCEVVECGDGERALQEFRQDPGRFDAVVLDHVMPRRSGRDTLKEIRKIRSEVPCVITSGYSAEVIIEQEPGGVVFLPKPFSERELCKSLETAIRGAAKPGG